MVGCGGSGGSQARSADSSSLSRRKRRGAIGGCRPRGNRHDNAAVPPRFLCICTRRASIQSKYAHVSTCTSIIVLTGRRAPSRLRLFFASDLSFSARTFHPPSDYILSSASPPSSSSCISTSQTASVFPVLVLFRLHTLPFSLLRVLFALDVYHPSFLRRRWVSFRTSETRDSIISRLLSVYLDLHPPDSSFRPPPVSTSVPSEMLGLLDLLSLVTDCKCLFICKKK